MSKCIIAGTVEGISQHLIAASETHLHDTEAAFPWETVHRNLLFKSKLTKNMMNEL